MLLGSVILCKDTSNNRLSGPPIHTSSSRCLNIAVRVACRLSDGFLWLLGQLMSETMPWMLATGFFKQCTFSSKSLDGSAISKGAERRWKMRTEVDGFQLWSQKKSSHLLKKWSTKTTNQHFRTSKWPQKLVRQVFPSFYAATVVSRFHCDACHAISRRPRAAFVLSGTEMLDKFKYRNTWRAYAP